MGFYDSFFISRLVIDLLSWPVVLSGNQPCFLFSNDTHKPLENTTAMENTVIEFTFSLNECWKDENLKLFVFKEHEPYECVLFQTDDKCKRSSSTTTCSCVQNGTYLFKKTVYRSDNGLWLFTVRRGNVLNPTDDEILALTTFFITHPASVTRLEVDGNITGNLHILSRNQSTVVCYWENGNPPVTARLLDSNGNELTSATNGTALNYTVTSPDCHKRKDILCKSDDSERTLSVSLLTRCPPEFVNTSPKPVISSNIFTFLVRAHTTDIAQCILYELSESSRTRGTEDKCHPAHETKTENVSCSTTSTPAKFYAESSLDIDHRGKHCSCGMEGTVPDLNFTLQLHNFTEYSDGDWLLLVSNPGGCNTIDFTFRWLALMLVVLLTVIKA